MAMMGTLVRILPDQRPGTLFQLHGNTASVWGPDGKIQAVPIERLTNESGEPLRGPDMTNTPTQPDDATGRTGIGGNNPPEPIDDAFDLVKVRIDDAYDEARLWLDGEAITSQDVADGVAKLIDMLRAAHKSADEVRKKEKAPLDAAVQAIQDKYNPLLKRAKQAMDACKTALQSFLVEEERKKRAAEEVARREAEARQAALQELQKSADRANLADRERMEAAIGDAKRADAAATRAAKQKSQAKGAARAVGLRTKWTPHLTDVKAAATHYWKRDPSAFNALLLKLAEEDVAKGIRDIPGFEVTEEKRVA